MPSPGGNKSAGDGLREILGERESGVNRPANPDETNMDDVYRLRVLVDGIGSQWLSKGVAGWNLKEASTWQGFS